VCCHYFDALPWLRLPALPIDGEHRRCFMRMKQLTKV
jgi:hypothetical protein